MQLLYKTADVRASIREVLADPMDKRCIVVAFVGADAKRYLPSPKGIKLYCWPKAGGTNPDSIDELRSKGVDVIFVPRLHAKIYWSMRGGAVIGSANLTNNALGAGGLSEVAIRLPPGSIDISCILRCLKPIADFEAALRQLRRDHLRFYMRNPNLIRRSSKHKRRTFGQWLAAGKNRELWRLGWYDEDGDAPGDTIDDETSDHQRYLAVRKKGFLSDDRFVLEVLVVQDSTGDISISGLDWWIPELYRKSEDAAWRSFPHVWFANDDPSTGLRRPFWAKEPRFKWAIEKTLMELGGLPWLYKHSLDPNAKFLERLEYYYFKARAKS